MPRQKKPMPKPEQKYLIGDLVTGAWILYQGSRGVVLDAELRQHSIDLHRSDFYYLIEWPDRCRTWYPEQSIQPYEGAFDKPMVSISEV